MNKSYFYILCLIVQVNFLLVSCTNNEKPVEKDSVGVEQAY